MKLIQKLALGYVRARLSVLTMLSRRKAAERAFDLFCTPLKRITPNTPEIFEKAEKLNITVDGVSVVGHRWNHPQTKKLLILHGFESSSKSFDRYVDLLIRKRYEVLAFDAPAHGHSGGKRITLPLYSKTIEEIDRVYGPIDFFLAHSFGGLALMHYLEHREREAKTVLISPATETTSAIDSFFKFLRLKTELRGEFDRIIFERAGVWPDHFSIRRAIQYVKGEMLWFHDEDDEMTPVSDALKVRDDGHAHVHFVITKGLGHRRIYRESLVENRILEFF